MSQTTTTEQLQSIQDNLADNRRYTLASAVADTGRAVGPIGETPRIIRHLFTLLEQCRQKVKARRLIAAISLFSGIIDYESAGRAAEYMRHMYGKNIMPEDDYSIQVYRAAEAMEACAISRSLVIDLFAEHLDTLICSPGIQPPEDISALGDQLTAVGNILREGYPGDRQKCLANMPTGAAKMVALMLKGDNTPDRLASVRNAFNAFSNPAVLIARHAARVGDALAGINGLLHNAGIKDGGTAADQVICLIQETARNARVINTCNQALQAFLGDKASDDLETNVKKVVSGFKDMDETRSAEAKIAIPSFMLHAAVESTVIDPPAPAPIPPLTRLTADEIARINGLLRPGYVLRQGQYGEDRQVITVWRGCLEWQMATNSPDYPSRFCEYIRSISVTDPWPNLR